MYRLYSAEIKKAFNRDSKAAHEQVALLERTSNNALRLLTLLTDKKLGIDPAAWSVVGWNRTEPAIGAEAPGGGLVAGGGAGVNAPKLHRPRLAPVRSSGPPEAVDPIESLRTGDLVLSQDPASGALGFQGVIAVGTESASDAALMLYLESADAVSLSPVEPVWQAGQGWVAARDLKPGDYVRVPGGRAKIVSAAARPRLSRDLNVVLAEVGTLFVGEPAGMLVHDNSIVHPPSRSPSIERLT